MSLKKKLITGGIWIGVSTILVSLCSYIYRLILIRNLSVEDYGLLYAIIPIFLFATVFVDLGRGSAFIKYGSKYLAKGEKNVLKFLIKYYFKFKLKTGIIFLAVVFISSNFLTKYYFKDSRAFYLFISLGIIYLLTNIFFNYIRGLLKVFQDQKKYAIYEVIYILSELVLLLIFINMGFDLWSPVLALLIGPLISSLVFYYIIYKNYFPDFFKIIEKQTPNLLISIKSFARANIFFYIGNYILNYTDTYMLTYFTNLEAVGLYNVAVPTARIILFFSVAITFILFPLISSLKAKKDFITMNKLINMTYKLSFLFFLPLAIILVAYPEIILRILYSTEHINASIALQLLAISSIFTMIFSINTHILNGMGESKLNAKNIIWGVIFNVILNFILIPLYGINGAAFSTLCGYILMAYLGLNQIKRNVKQVKIKFAYFLKFAFMALIFFTIVDTLKKLLNLNIWLEIFLILIISGSVYVGLLFLFKILNIKNLKETIYLFKSK